MLLASPLYPFNDLSDDVIIRILSFLEPRCTFNITNRQDLSDVQFTEITIKGRTKYIPMFSILSAVCSKWRKIVLSLPIWQTFDWVQLMSAADYATPSRYDRFFESFSAVPERTERIKTVVIRVSYLRYPGYERTLLKILANSNHMVIRIVLREADESDQSEWEQSIKDRVSSAIPEIRKSVSISNMCELSVDFAYVEGLLVDVAFEFIETDILSRLELVRLENCLDARSLLRCISSVGNPISWKTFSLQRVGLKRSAQSVLTELLTGPLLPHLQRLIVNYEWLEREVIDPRIKSPALNRLEVLASRILAQHLDLKHLTITSYYGYDRDFLRTIRTKLKLETLTINHEPRGTVWYENHLAETDIQRPDFRDQLKWLCDEQDYLESLGILCRFEAAKDHVKEAELRFDNAQESPQGPIEVFNDENWIFDF
ncbi:hypothetical protein NEOLI_004558 [Neolecta irregularis DAH-3]|uniref:F-box domain-containing protein n=1 Tax=Neolecta irregularis (strain DAH-3) TaxID=1198029 RepID=A0A1U7LLZ1_NEOID|nr:hypothetical protein NEOLI_004558 [Neolecta irregularis DAH-3]|eukprot:OLL23562.1 hypothetical protein NEOLI_004558 [Neolecta irregularis DAH-3]